METVGVLHPGHMGAALAAAIKNSGSRVIWASEGRSAGTRDRAADVGLDDVDTLDRLVQESTIVVSICPPESAVDVAGDVASRGFAGLYVDGNAVSPQRMEEIARVAGGPGAGVVDGGVIGPPPWKAGTTRLYLSGGDAKRFAVLFDGTPCDARVVGDGIGPASALKMSFAAYTKGGWALQAACLALADSHSLLGNLKEEWDLWRPGLVAETEAALEGCAPKAWRFTGEMDLIAETFESAGLPPEFHRAARAVWERWAHHRGEENATPPVDEMLKELPVDGP